MILLGDGKRQVQGLAKNLSAVHSPQVRELQCINHGLKDSS